jgi:LysM repeat protein
MVTPHMPGEAGSATQATYNVVVGDTLILIGDKVEVPWRTLVEINNLENRDLIKPGDVLILPWVDYIVNAGDYLKRIAAEHGRGVSWQVLAYFNNISDPNLIHAGEIIKIPV